MTLAELVAYVGIYNIMTLSNGPVMLTMLERTLVTERHAITIDRLMFALTIGRVTPGPASSYVASTGFMMFGLVGALATTAAIVVPAYLVLPLVSGYERIRRLRGVDSFMTGLIAAQVGLIFCSIVRLARESVVSVGAAAVCSVTFVLTYVFKQRAPVALAAAGVVGTVIRLYQR
jgi:chromate transporter